MIIWNNLRTVRLLLYEGDNISISSWYYNSILFKLIIQQGKSIFQFPPKLNIVFWIKYEINYLLIKCSRKDPAWNSILFFFVSIINPYWTISKQEVLCKSVNPFWRLPKKVRFLVRDYRSLIWYSWAVNNLVNIYK